MTTVLDWIARSMRMLGVLTAGRVPDGKMAADALEAANGLILALPEVGNAPTLKEVIVSGDYEAGENERIVNTTGADITVTLPETIKDCGRERTPVNGARVVIAGDAPITFIYLSNSGWHKVSGLTLNDAAPLGGELYTGLCAVLAVHLAPEYDVEPSATIVSLAQAGLLNLATQFWTEEDVTGPAEYVLMSDKGYGWDSGAGWW